MGTKILRKEIFLIVIVMIGVLISGCIDTHLKTSDEVKEHIKAMKGLGEEILKNDTKFRNIDGWEKSKTERFTSHCSNEICNVVFEVAIENKSYVAWIDLFSKKVLTTKEIKIEKNKSCSNGGESRENIFGENNNISNKLLNIALEDEGVKEIIGKNAYTVSGHGTGCMGGYEFGTLTLNVGGFYDFGGQTYTIFIDVSDKKVLSKLKH